MPLAPKRPRRRSSTSLIEALDPRRLFSFGLTTTSTSYVVDSGGGIVCTVLRNGAAISSTVHLGDLTSVKYNGTETLATYAQTSRYSHYEQGLTSDAVISATVDPNGQWIKITCDDSAAASGGVIQYYVAKKGDANLYMASLPTDVNNGPGEGRFIAYMSHPLFPNIEAASDNTNSDGTVEGSDVFYNTTTGITTSKFYNTRRMIDNTVHGITGNGIGAFMNMGDREHSSGGPFFKDIDFQTTSAYSTEMYNCLFTGHEQTEAFRQGLQGPYAMQYTNGSAPVAPDYSFLEGVGISGLVGAAGRGAITGTASGVTTSGHQTTVTLTNSAAQYWGYADGTTGAYSITGVLPGTYVETIYDNELAVGTRTVTIAAGKAIKANIADTYSTPLAIWRIGTWDGTPKEFLNADKIYYMHPSDPRMTPFVDTTYTVGTTTAAQWPLAEWKDPSLDDTNRVTFTLTAAQAAQANTMRIGITDAFAGGRPIISINGGSYSAAQSPSTQPDSRSITRGTWRGNNFTYSYVINANVFKAGTNTIDIEIASGSSGGTPYLMPNVVFDALDLVPTASLTNAPKLTTLAVTPANPVVVVNSQQTFVASGKDQFGNPIATNVVWTASRGSIDDAGNFVAPAMAGSVTLTATSGTTVGTTAVNVVVPTVVNRTIFYNNSKFDGNDATANSADDAAIATDKSALLPGGTATFANYTSYSRGINGLMIDVANLPATPLTTADFAFAVGNSNDTSTWTAAPAPTTVLVRGGAGVNGSARVELVWPDNAIQKQWLRVTMLADALTGLAANDLFYFGNAIGETGDSTTNALVNATDALAANNHPAGPFTPAGLANLYDFNRDGLVNATDALLANGNTTSPFTALILLQPPTTALATGAAAKAVTATTKTTTVVAPKPLIVTKAAVVPVASVGTSATVAVVKKPPTWLASASAPIV